MDVPRRLFRNQFDSLLSVLEKRGLAPKHLENRILKQFSISKEEFRMVLGAMLLGSLTVALAKGCASGFTASDDPSAHLESPEVTTLIPKGHVLVPIQLKNYESVDSILGSVGIVDLYVKDQKGLKTALVENAKIIRAPKNRSVIAVLAPENQAQEILKGEQNGLYAVVKNREGEGTNFVNHPPKNKNRISYLSED